MKTLILIRHGKAEAPVNDDFSRALSAEGKKQIQSITEQLLAGGAAPEIIFTSPATRAVQSSEIFNLIYSKNKIYPKVETVPGMYKASVTDLLTFVTSLQDSLSTVVLIGHNPVFEDFASWITKKPVAMGTGNCISLTLSIDRWENTGSTQSSKLQHIYP